MRITLFLWTLAFTCLAQTAWEPVAGAAFLRRPAPALKVSVGRPRAITVSPQGELFIAGRTIIFRLDRTGSLVRLAGSVYTGFSGDGGPAVDALLSSVQALVFGRDGRLYLIDGQRIRVIDTKGVITTFAGTGERGSTGHGTQALQARFQDPLALALDSSGDLYVADSANHRVRRISPNGIITNFAGNGNPEETGDGGPALSASLQLPSGLAFDAAGNLYIGDAGNYCIRKVTPNGTISRFAGFQAPRYLYQGGFSGDGGRAGEARMFSTVGLTIDASGNLLFADRGNLRVRRITPAGIISTIAGDGKAASSGDGGKAAQAQLLYPNALAWDAAGSLYVSELFRIRRIAPDGSIATIAGNGFESYSGDGGPAEEAQLFQPSGLSYTQDGSLWIADSGNHAVRQITPDGLIRTVAGKGTKGFSGDGGHATNAQLNRPLAVAVAPEGPVYIADTDNQRVRRVELNGAIQTYAGNGVSANGRDNDRATLNYLRSPSWLAFDAGGNFLIGDFSSRIRKVTGDGIIGSLAGAAYYGFWGDGGQAIRAFLSTPAGIALATDGSVIFADRENHRIRRVNPKGIIDTIAGGGSSRGLEGEASELYLGFPESVACGRDGSVIFLEPRLGLVRRLDSAGSMTTFPRTLDPATLPRGLASDGDANLWVSLSYSNLIVRLKLAP